ncbi:DegT/DnrJ/EryC1/StrS family aminotransferase [Thalassotalea ponticola]|uniref:DegT/DnrJ/EryC1/StrS aminotransferase family protein n=1 Tax=Thalassotalea ponticola TaxID=1523392 RepID=UPI0025B33D09|nr:DegT/DnrJ/EryC1/StrS family aminotransferase [Thalassotalea ponticola]MDN3652648.1 DegT/DnrJ/EryC1/StrS family aminotransferase [Thalassotalea ponticola]
MIALNSPVKPNLNKLLPLLEKVNNSGWYTNFGPLHNELTERLEDYLGVKNLLLTNNGTSALQVAAKAIGSRSILATPFSFVATVSAFKWQQDDVAFTDIDAKTLNLCPDAIMNAYRKGCKADTIVATHVYGNPCDVKGINAVSEKNNCQIIYDAAHAFGVKLNNGSVLNYGHASTLSFHATKIFHTVEGGAIVFKDKGNFETAREIINFGINPENGIVDVGINAKLNEYQAAVGLVNLEEIDDIVNHRAELFYAYRNGLKDIVELPEWHPEANANGAYMPVLLNNAETLKKVSQVLNNRNIQSRHYFSPSLDEIFEDSPSFGTTNSLNVANRILCLPLHAHLTIEDVNTVISAIKEGI